MQRLFQLLLVLTLSGMAANKLDDQFCRTAIAGLAAIASFTVVVKIS